MKSFNVSTVSFEEVDSCANGQEGNKLMYKLSVATSSLNPPHKYAPWVNIDGKHSSDAENDLQSFLCGGPLKDVQECQKIESNRPIIQLV
jgi:hypothetical protein